MLNQVTKKVVLPARQEGFKVVVESALNSATTNLVNKRVAISNGKGARVTAQNLHSMEVKQKGREYELFVYNKHPRTGEPISAGNSIPLSSTITLIHAPLVETSTKPDQASKPTATLKPGSITETPDGLQIPDVSKTNASTLATALKNFVGTPVIITIKDPQIKLSPASFIPAKEKQVSISSLEILPIESELSLQLRDKSTQENTILDLGRVGGASITIQKADANTIATMKTKIAEEEAKAALKELESLQNQPLRINSYFPIFNGGERIRLMDALKKRNWFGETGTPVRVQGSLDYKQIDRICTIRHIESGNERLRISTNEGLLEIDSGDIIFSKPNQQ